MDPNSGSINLLLECRGARRNGVGASLRDLLVRQEKGWRKASGRCFRKASCVEHAADDGKAQARAGEELATLLFLAFWAGEGGWKAG